MSWFSVAPQGNMKMSFKPKIMRNTLSLGLFLILLIWAGCKKYEPKIDHFKVWIGEKTDTSIMVELQGQWDDSLRKIEVRHLFYFANPVKKIVDSEITEIIDPDHHLAGYYFSQVDADTDLRWVRFKNQFGTQMWELEYPYFVWLPTFKPMGAHNPPENLDHYKCYRVTKGDNIAKSVTLEDQFDVRLKKTESIETLIPFHFCLPVRKEREGEESKPIYNEIDHLAFYRIKQEVDTLDVLFGNQFDTLEWPVYASDGLLVPSKKLKFGPLTK